MPCFPTRKTPMTTDTKRIQELECELEEALADWKEMIRERDAWMQEAIEAIPMVRGSSQSSEHAFDIAEPWLERVNTKKPDLDIVAKREEWEQKSHVASAMLKVIKEENELLEQTHVQWKKDFADQQVEAESAEARIKELLDENAKVDGERETYLKDLHLVGRAIGWPGVIPHGLDPGLPTSKGLIKKLTEQWERKR